MNYVARIRVADPVWYWPDPDPTPQDKPDPDPTSQDKPDPDLEKFKNRIRIRNPAHRRTIAISRVNTLL